MSLFLHYSKNSPVEVFLICNAIRFFVATETQCKKAYREECVDCQAAQSCGNYLTITTGDSRLECEEKCNQTINCYLMVYSAGRYSKCILYNCSEVEYHQGSDAIVYSCNSGKSQHCRLLFFILTYPMLP